jgi:hypothetical protein
VIEEDINNLKEWASIGSSTKNSIWDSIWVSVGDSIKDSVGVYVTSFFNIEYNFNRDCLLKLYARGFVPSYDGTTWRLHSGTKAEIVYEWPIH